MLFRSAIMVFSSTYSHITGFANFVEDQVTKLHPFLIGNFLRDMKKQTNIECRPLQCLQTVHLCLTITSNVTDK